MFRSFALALACSSVALVAASAVPPEAAPPAATPPAPDSPAIVVKGVTAKTVDTYVRQMTAAQDGGQVSRWTSPPCPIVVNLQPDIAEAIKQRILAVAREAGAPTPKASCKPNVLIVFTAQPEAAVQQIRHYYPDLFRFDTSNDRPDANYKDLMVPRPIRWIDASDRVNADGSMIGQESALFQGFGVPVTNTINHATDLETATIQSATLSIEIVDATKLQGLDTGQLADYLAIVALSRPRLATTFRGSTILAMFDQRDRGEAIPAGLTDQDRSFLKQLYDTSNVHEGDHQRASIAYRMRHPSDK